VVLGGKGTVRQVKEEASELVLLGRKLLVVVGIDMRVAEAAKMTNSSDARPPD
jgi:hypothetical protein